MSSVDPYHVLDLPYGASRSEIKAAWRVAARKFHPDTNPDNHEQAERLFQQAREAYDTLMSSVRDVREPDSDTGPAANARDDSELPTHDPFGFWPGPAANGADLRVDAHIDLKTAMEGGTAAVTLRYPVGHHDCGGQGCESCHAGMVEMAATFTTRIQPMTPDGAMLSLSRRGGAGTGGGKPGDLTITVRVDQDPVWLVKQRDIYAHVDITAAAGIAGARLMLPHPVSTVGVDVPAGSYAPFTVTYPGGGIGGDAHVRVTPVPIDVSDPATAAALRALDEAQRAYLQRS